ncbi:hypothetical protein THRCLA_04468 [Thraustotheca clavata]|uniref:Uncharacterized protein n=1 Tax=Thraustotheca clavata TaxID=74557 RepID=A0A1V9ZYZ1_9STRA|nr:hypothetical protein THRCLA_04468 [Thraustotheca clavata]
MSTIKAAKPTLSQNTLAMKFMQRKNTPSETSVAVKIDQDEWKTEENVVGEDGILVTVRDVPDPSMDKQLGRRSFGGYNAAVEEEEKASKSQRRHADANKRALKDEVSAEEMAERPLTAIHAPLHTPLRTISSHGSLPNLPSSPKVPDVMAKVHGFYRVNNEDDLRLSIEGLNSLFNQALDMENGECSTPKPKQKKQIKESIPVRSPRSAEYWDKAVAILDAKDQQFFSQLLESPEMTSAFNITGIRKEELLLKPRSEFQKECNRAWSVPPEVAALRFELYEKMRRSSLALLLHVIDSQEPPSSAAPHDFDRQLENERHLLEGMIRGRLRYEKVQESGVFHRRAEENHTPHLKDEAHAERCEINRLKMERVQKQRALLEQARQENSQARQRYEQSRIANTQKEKDDQIKQKRLIDEERERKRHQVVEDAKECDRQRREMIESAVQEKEAYLREKRDLVAKENMIAKERKRLAQQEREMTVQRMKNIQAYQKDEAAKRIQATNRRVDNLKEIRRAIVQERNRIHVLTRNRQGHIRDLREEISLSPGPGEYDIHWLKNIRGGYVGQSTSKLSNSLYPTPGPGAYEYLGTMSEDMKKSGLSFGKSKYSDSMLASINPGPGQYIDPLKVLKSPGPSFAQATVTPLEVKHAAELPAPCDYSENHATKHYSKSTKEFKRALHTMTTAYLQACKGKEEIMIDKDIHALEVAKFVDN